MNPQTAAVVQRCAQAAHTGELDFSQIVAQLMEIGVERYHVDYSRQEITYYFSNGESLVVPSIHEPHSTADVFSPAEVAAAVRQSQRGEHTYDDFVRKTKAAGCVGYFAQLTGRSVLYFGRRGETHVEHFPSAPSP